LKLFRKIKYILSIAAIAAVAAFGYNAAINLHYHVNSSGVIVYHAHPYSADDGSPTAPGHSHSDSELNWLALLTSAGLSSLLVIAAFILPKINFNKSHYFDYLAAIPLGGSFIRFKLRGPPLIG
jgi:hypothetical protein